MEVQETIASRRNLKKHAPQNNPIRHRRRDIKDGNRLDARRGVLEEVNVRVWTSANISALHTVWSKRDLRAVAKTRKKEESMPRSLCEGNRGGG